jgi:hypothetical protein
LPASGTSAANATQVVQPTLPRALGQSVDGTLDPSYNRAADIFVAAGGNLQAALDAAQPGQIVELQAGATWTGSYTLRNKTGSSWIYIRSSRYQELPAPGERVGPEHAHLMPKIVVQNSFSPALKTDASAHNYRLIGIEFLANQDASELVKVGPLDYETNVNQLAHHITFDRVYIHGHANYESTVGITVNGRHIAVIDSYISEIHDIGQDSQAILGWNGDGPLKIVNNYLEAAGENVMFGGVDPAITNLVPSDIEIRGNHFSKPLSWKNAIASGPHAGSKWSVKNIFELKNAQRVLIEGNLFEHNWIAAQQGSAIVFTVRNQDGDAPWSAVQDIIFRNNIVRDSEHFLNLTGEDDLQTSQQTKRILVENNLVYDIRARLVLLTTPGAPILDLTIRHNTMLHTGAGSTFIYAGDSTAVAENFIFVDNIVTHGQYGFHFPFGNVDTWLRNYEFENNVVVGGNTNVPAGNRIADHIGTVGFRNVEADDYRLRNDSAFKRAGSDGSDVGIVTLSQ